MARAREPASSQGDALDDIMDSLDRNIDDVLEAMDVDDEPTTAARGDGPRGAASDRLGRDLGIDEEVHVKVRKKVPKLDAKM
jgi:hypothetical protein